MCIRDRFCMCDKCEGRRCELRRESRMSAPLSDDGHDALMVFLSGYLSWMPGWEMSMWRGVSWDFKEWVDKSATNLSIVNCKGTRSSGYRVIHEMRALRNISMRDSPLVNNLFLAQVLANRPKLESLDLSFCSKVTKLGLECPDMTSLKVAGTHIADQDLVQVLDRCPKLMHLDVTLCPRLTWKGFAACGKCSSLKSVSVANCHLSDKGLSEMSKCGSLTELNVAGCDLSDESLLDVLEGNSGLTALNLTGCSHLTDKVLEPLTWTSPEGQLEACPWLETLNLSECTSLTDDKILEVTQLRPELRIFGIRARRLFRSPVPNPRGSRACSMPHCSEYAADAMAHNTGRPLST
eukprot:TRINITY_DN20330_c0_g1_i4.p1 TRINITY_DN20330_c0_g1~~TRINITY_DN20330_c0_g1_i4.p1  ORF type:complete len:351 (-),score=56.59 TRINITY_DN20330_c0_g1_i4:494-1546(-)